MNVPLVLREGLLTAKEEWLVISEIRPRRQTNRSDAYVEAIIRNMDDLRKSDV